MTSILTKRLSQRMAPRLLLLTKRTSILPQRQTMSVMVTKTSSTNNDTTPIQQQNVNPSPIEISSSNNNFSIDTDQLHVTESCMKRVESLAKKREESLDDVYLRVYVDAGGCSGFQYKFEMTLDRDEAVDTEDDVVFCAKDSGARVVVDSASMELIQGSTIDFVQEMIKSAFAVVDNPKSESACGCGSSFAIKNFEANPALD